MNANVKDNRYPFRIRKNRKGITRAKIIIADNYRNALNKILALYPAKFVLTKHARKMDLISAKVEAAKESKVQKTKVYVYAEKDGEVEYSINSPTKAGLTLLHIYNNGAEVKISPDINVASDELVQQPKEKSITTKKQKTMSKVKTTKKKAISATTKPAAKKSGAPKKSSGKGKMMSIKAILALVNKGSKAFNVAGKPLPAGYLGKMADQSREMEVIISE